MPFPVKAGVGPLHSAQAEIARGGEICRRAHAARRTRKLRLHTREIADDLLRAVKLPASFPCALIKKDRVRVGMIPDRMPTVCDPSRNPRVTLDVAADHKKRRFKAICIQRVDDLLGLRRRAIVESQREHNATILAA